MKRVGVFLGAQKNWGGTFQYNEAILNAVLSLDRNRYEPVVAYLYDDWEAIVAQGGAETHRFAMGGTGRIFDKVWRQYGVPLNKAPLLWRLFHPVVKGLHSLDCDLWVFPSVDVFTYQMRTRTLGVILDLMHRYEPEFPEVSENGEYERRENHFGPLCQNATGILVDSELGREQVVESYGISPAKVHPLPFIPPAGIVGTEDADGLRERLSLPERFFYYPGQFWEHKNHARLIRALSLISESHPDVHLVFSGFKDRQYQELVELAHKQDVGKRVHFVGYVEESDVGKLYRLADALVMPTFFGPTNIPPLEAMQAGCPVAVSDIYAAREQLGDAAVYFNPRSVEALGHCLRTLWDDASLRERLSEAGLKRSSRWTEADLQTRFSEIVASVLQ